jgi:ribonuclease D
MPNSKRPPDKEHIATLEPFEGLGMECITVITSLDQAESAYEDLSGAGDVGFDTESKPTFRKGEVSEGPHVLQFSTTGRAYIFQSHVGECLPVVMRLLESTTIQKIGFGLRGDLSHISNRFGIRPSSIHDLDRSFKQLGYRNPVGAKSAVAMLFERRLLKSKNVTTSNWGSTMLTEKQLIYAANDAYAALRVYHALREIG